MRPQTREVTGLNLNGEGEPEQADVPPSVSV